MSEAGRDFMEEEANGPVVEVHLGGGAPGWRRTWEFCAAAAHTMGCLWIVFFFSLSALYYAKSLGQ
jgi:hypothetical protein